MERITLQVREVIRNPRTLWAFNQSLSSWTRVTPWLVQDTVGFPWHPSEDNPGWLPHQCRIPQLWLLPDFTTITVVTLNIILTGNQYCRTHGKLEGAGYIRLWREKFLLEKEFSRQEEDERIRFITIWNPDVADSLGYFVRLQLTTIIHSKSIITNVVATHLYCEQLALPLAFRWSIVQ